MVINLVLSFIGTFVGILIGGIITWLVARKYYVHSSDDLRQESSNLRIMINVLINYLADNEMIKIKRDDQGNVLGYIIPRKKWSFRASYLH